MYSVIIHTTQKYTLSSCIMKINIINCFMYKNYIQCKNSHNIFLFFGMYYIMTNICHYIIKKVCNYYTFTLTSILLTLM